MKREIIKVRGKKTIKKNQKKVLILVSHLKNSRKKPKRKKNVMSVVGKK